jgi:hypothetical protein
VRFSLRWLFGLVAFAAIACLSLIYASPILSKILYAAVLAFLAMSLLGAIYSGRARRPFWGGCAILGCLYVASSYLPLKSTNPWFVAAMTLSDVHENTARRVPLSNPGSFKWNPPQSEFIEAGQSLIAFIVAMAGGLSARWFYARDKRTPTFS